MSPPPSWPIGFRTLLVRAVLYVLFIAAITQGTYLEALYLSSVRFSEWGFTEFTQTLMLAICCTMLIYIRQVLRVWPNVTLLLLAFLAASLVREQDHFLDTYVADNTWKVLVALIIFPSLFWVIKQRQRFFEEFTHYSNTFAFGLFAAGVLTTYIFSRLYGRQEFWQAILEDSYSGTFKSVAEEVVELLGYSLILIATLELLLLARRIYKARQTSS
ncbi:MULTISPECIES: hypothetical protein [unclassified Halomonas]|uniref:hypothetical protein n=1 Tax=unclassified Halomonas TaxID=2609666 RepID=UPI0007D91C59|nr:MULTISPECIES: hypothetical protein [unclassified Halomonas]MBT2785123.1 hypothetical protein [Halomonas sp. ISL-106]MBT2796817.1 hypothetical protein [Halomonas sp. ISL-104]OAL60043.1 hypothetical protein A6R74_01880 [Halomonas sp. ALS9]